MACGSGSRVIGASREEEFLDESEDERRRHDGNNPKASLLAGRAVWSVMRLGSEQERHRRIKATSAGRQARVGPGASRHALLALNSAFRDESTTPRNNNQLQTAELMP